MKSGLVASNGRLPHHHLYRDNDSRAGPAL